jgi:hypothetical protein
LCHLVYQRAEPTQISEGGSCTAQVAKTYVAELGNVAGTPLSIARN